MTALNVPTEMSDDLVQTDGVLGDQDDAGAVGEAGGLRAR
jgi:hypothetical protein